MKDPMNHWYSRDWRKVPADEKGKTRFEYVGEYYGYGLEGKALRRMKLGLAGACALFVAVYLLSALVVSEGAMWRWVGLFQILTLLGAIYLCMAVGRICLSGERMPYRDYHAGPLRLKKAAWACAILSGLTLLAELVYIVVFPCRVGRELVFVAEILVYAAVAVGFIRFGKKRPCTMVEEPKEV